MEFNLFFSAIIIYLIGSIPFGFLLTKFFGLGDIRKVGSGNIGATNVLRTGNKFIAFIVLFLDILKGYVPTLIMSNYFDDQLTIYIIGSLAIFGHIFPIWLIFKGGKGVATYIGFILAVNPFMSIIFVFAWLIMAFLKKYSSLASIFSLTIIPFFWVFFIENTRFFIFFLIISIVLIIKHHTNIKRLLNKKEQKINL